MFNRKGVISFFVFVSLVSSVIAQEVYPPITEAIDISLNLSVLTIPEETEVLVTNFKSENTQMSDYLHELVVNKLSKNNLKVVDTDSDWVISGTLEKFSKYYLLTIMVNQNGSLIKQKRQMVSSESVSAYLDGGNTKELESVVKNDTSESGEITANTSSSMYTEVPASELVVEEKDEEIVQEDSESTEQDLSEKNKEDYGLIGNAYYDFYQINESKYRSWFHLENGEEVTFKEEISPGFGIYWRTYITPRLSLKAELLVRSGNYTATITGKETTDIVFKYMSCDAAALVSYSIPVKKGELSIIGGAHADFPTGEPVITKGDVQYLNLLFFNDYPTSLYGAILGVDYTIPLVPAFGVTVGAKVLTDFIESNLSYFLRWGCSVSIGIHFRKY